LTDDLIAEGLARELIHAVQNLRKQLDCEYTDRIHLALVTEDESLRHAAEQFADYLKEETLATELTFEPLEGSEPAEVKIGGSIVQLHARVVNPAA
jgi:isoleucyl-tRNA synthetase